MKAKPVRLQMKRTKGFNLQKESIKVNGLPCVLVSRPTKWGNPFKTGNREKDAIKYSEILHRRSFMIQSSIDINVFSLERDQKIIKLREALYYDIDLIKGKNLACWCKKTDYCHADVLLKLANI